MSKKPLPKSKSRETSPSILKPALIRRFDRRITGHGELEFPCLPAMIDPYMAKLSALWTVIGKPFSAEELANLRKALEGELARGYKASVYSRVTVRYQTHRPPHPGIEWFISAKVLPLEEVYVQWGTGQDAPLFGRHADAKLLAVAAELGEPASVPVLDIGAGVGRNSLPMARLGHPTCAVEPVGTMADAMRRIAEEEKLPLEVVQGDIFAPDLPLQKGHYKVVILAEVTSHFREIEDMRRLYTKLADLLVPGGLALVSSFLTAEGYKPDEMARQAAQALWSTVYTRSELSFITQELPFDKVSDESVHDYEKEHLPPRSLAPHQLVEAWTQAGDVFALPLGKAPVELRWTVYRRR